MVIGNVNAAIGATSERIRPMLDQVAGGPLGSIQRRLDQQVWAAVAEDAQQPGAREVALAMLAASQVSSPPADAVDGAAGRQLADGAAPADQVVALVNEARSAFGLAPVTLDPKLVDVAAAHSRRMAERQQMAHDGIGDGGPAHRIRSAIPTARRTAENVAAGQPDAASVMRSWMESPGHRKNILDPELRSIGVEVATGPDGAPYWTQVFAG